MLIDKVIIRIIPHPNESGVSPKEVIYKNKSINCNSELYRRDIKLIDKLLEIVTSYNDIGNRLINDGVDVKDENKGNIK